MCQKYGIIGYEVGSSFLKDILYGNIFTTSFVLSVVKYIVLRYFDSFKMQ